MAGFWCFSSYTGQGLLACEPEEREEEPAAATGLFVITARDGEQVAWSSLAETGLEKGDSLGQDVFLVRLPLDKVEEVRKAGVSLEPYPVASRLAEDLIDEQSAEVEVLVTLFYPEDKKAVAVKVRELGGEITDGLTGSGRVLCLRISREKLEELASFPEVVFVEPVPRYQFYNEHSRDLVGVTPLQAPGFFVSGGAGLTGAGQVIGLADSGIDSGSIENIHPDLRSISGQKPKVIMLQSWAGAASARDPNGHGTHMSATVAGTGAASQGRFKGIAPAASIYFQGLLDDQGKLAPPPDLKTLFEPAYAAGVRVHINGWGGDTEGYYGAANQVDCFVRRCPDFLAVFSAGNNGSSEGGVTPEAYSKNGLAVGASQSPYPVFNPEQRDAAAVASFSSQGPTRDGRIKPEIYAPGAVISAKSSLLEGDSDFNEHYIYMEGTSMASAVAGGSAALLREYFQRFEKHSKPSAALLKAALISGARAPEGGPNRHGFGILDMGGTVLALKEKSFQYLDDADGVATGETQAYTFEVKSGDAPFKATLVWTDPEAAPGSSSPLVNNLDLVVHGPDGEKWLGNSFLYNHPDTVNNVEQVFIPQPAPGTYTIEVKGTRVTKGVVSSKDAAQDFALVFGQPLVRDLVTESKPSCLNLASGSTLATDQLQVHYIRDGKVVPWPPTNKNLAGTDLYLSPETGTAYLVGRTWHSSAVQLIEAGKRLILTEISPKGRTGGLFLTPAAVESLWVNGTPVKSIDQVPLGGEVTAWLNPTTQEIWRADFSFNSAEGFLSGVDLKKRELTLIGEEKPFALAPQAALAYFDQLADVESADIPFGAAAIPHWEELLPGLKVRLVRSSTTGEVTYVGAQRELATGMITAVDEENNKITLSTGQTYTIPAGISLSLDQRSVQLNELHPGQYAVVLILPKTQQALSLSAYSRVAYGRIVYTSAKNKMIYFIDDYGRSGSYYYDQDTGFYRWGLPAEESAIEPDAWVRIFLKPGEDLIWRIDLAETAGEREEKIISFDAEKKILKTDGGSYSLTGRTSVTKNGYPVDPCDLIPGEKATVTPYLDDLSGNPILAAVAARTSTGASAPSLEIAAPWRDGQVKISGVTTADRIYIYREAEQRENIPIEKDGRFTYAFHPEQEKGETSLLVVAVNRHTGGVTGQYLTIPDSSNTTFSDMSGHWAADVVEDLTAQHIIKGYPDGTFRPDKPITRVEFTALITGALGWQGIDQPLSFVDAPDIPEWAKPVVAEAHKRGLIKGSTDGRFYPDRTITRAEATVILSGALKSFNSEEPTDDTAGWRDEKEIPFWAQQAAEQVAAAGVMTGRPGQLFAPEATLTRAETASAVHRLLEKVVRSNKVL